MQVIIAIVILEVRGEFSVIWNMADLVPNPAARPSPDVPEFRGCEPEGIKIVGHP
jgi:hypothetical protein